MLIKLTDLKGKKLLFNIDNVIYFNDFENNTIIIDINNQTSIVMESIGKIESIINEKIIDIERLKNLWEK